MEIQSMAVVFKIQHDWSTRPAETEKKHHKGEFVNDILRMNFNSIPKLHHFWVRTAWRARQK